MRSCAETERLKRLDLADISDDQSILCEREAPAHGAQSMLELRAVGYRCGAVVAHSVYSPSVNATDTQRLVYLPECLCVWWAVVLSLGRRGAAEGEGGCKDWSLQSKKTTR